MEATQNLNRSIRLDVLAKGEKISHSSEFAKEKIVLGRILSADLRIDDPHVSRIHALIEIRGEQVLLTDLASTHGTYVNGEKIVERALNIGDVIRLGKIEIRIEKGTGKLINAGSSFDGKPVFDADETLQDMDHADVDDSMNRRERPDRRKKDALPDERRLDDRRGGDRRIDQRGKDRRKDTAAPGELKKGETRKDAERRNARDYERRVGERRRSDRRIFDITSLERRIEDRRTRNAVDDLLPQELEAAFETPKHARELEVTVLWGDHILDVSNYVNPTVVTAGESPANHYIIPSVGIPEEFPLLTIEEDGTAYLAFTEKMIGTVRARDKIYSLKDLKKENFLRRVSDYYVLALKQDDFAKITIGSINFFALYVRPAPRIKNAPIFDRDPLVMRTTIGSLLLLAILMLGVQFFPKPTPVTIEMIPERFAKIVIKSRPVIKSNDGIVAKGEENKQGGSEMGVGGPPMGPEGQVGKPNLPKKEPPQALTPKSKPKEEPAPVVAKEVPKPKPNVPPRKMVDPSKAKTVGLTKAFNASGLQKDLKALINKGEGKEGPGGLDDFGKAVNGLRGKGIEETGGAGGKGLKGVDVGGGGKTVGIDGPSSGGLGRGYKGTGIGEGISGPGRLGQKGEHAISIVSENVQVLSGLPKDVINAVVQRHRSEIRACYDAALVRNPKVRGKVVVAFNIQANGIVSTSVVKESTVGDTALDNCISSRVKTWVFPKPEAPVVTEVTAYPFYLNPAN